MVSLSPGSRVVIKRPGVVQGIRVTAGPTGPAGADGAPGAGDVDGPASSVNNNIAVFNGTTGKIIKDGGATIASLAPAAASTTVSGVVELATNTEATTGTDTARAVTPAGGRAHGDARYAQNTGGGREKSAALSATTGTCTGDVSAANIFTITPTGNFTIAFSNIPAGPDGVTITVIITSGATAYTPTFPAASDWGTSSPPTLTANKTTIVNFLTVNGGTKLHARAS